MITNTTAYLLGSSVVAFIVIGLIKEWIKKFIGPRFGDLGIQVSLLLTAIVLSAIGYGWQWLPSDITVAIGIIFSGATALYYVLYKAIYQKAIKKKLDTTDIKK